MLKIKKERTALLLAVERRFWDMVVRLVNMYNFDFDTQDNLGRKPLLLASRGGDEEAVSSLLDKNAKPNLSDKRSRTPLSEAAQDGHGHIVNLLLQTAEFGDEHGRDKREKVKVDACDDTGQTALMLAAENGLEHVVDSPLKNNADSGLMDNGGKKAWQRAMENGHVRVVNNLLKLRQDAPGQDLAGVNDALLLASRKGWTELVEVLLDREADVTFQAKGSQSTALHLAAMGGHVPSGQETSRQGRRRGYQGCQGPHRPHARHRTRVRVYCPGFIGAIRKVYQERYQRLHGLRSPTLCR